MVRKNMNSLHVVGVIFVLALGLVLMGPSLASAAETAEGFCQSWLLLGQYNQPDGAGPGDALMRRDFLTDGAGVREDNIVPTDGMTINTDYNNAAASLGFDPGTLPYTVPTVFAWAEPDDLVDFSAILGDYSNVMMYAFTYVTNTTGAPLSTYVGVDSDDSIQVLINSVEVGCISIPRGQSGTNNVANSWPAILQPGVNLVTVKVFEGGGDFNFRFRLQTANVTGVVDSSTAQPNVTYDILPAGYISPANIATATRAISGIGIYMTGEPTAVRIAASKVRGTPSPVVVEVPPSGWTLSATSASLGSVAQAGGRITWTMGAMTSNTAAMTYVMTPNALAGDQRCSGTIMTNLLLPVAGDRLLVPTTPLGIFDWHGNIGLDPLGQPGGDPSTPGGANLAAGTYTIAGSGDDVWDPLDRCHIVMKRMRGDFYMEALVNFSAPGSDEWATAAIMVRSKHEAHAAWGAIAMRNPFFGTRPTDLQIMGFEWRERNWGNCGGTNTEEAMTQPRIMRVIRQGTMVRGFYRNDGGQWIEQVESPHVVPDLLNDEVLACFFVTSCVNGGDATAQFSNVTTGGLPVRSAARDIQATEYSTSPIHVVIDILHRSNSTPLTVTETLPAGWTASAISDGGIQTGANITWTLATFTADKQVSYDVTPTAGLLPKVFTGFARDDLGIVTNIGGDSVIAAAGTTAFQQGRQPTPSYAGCTDAHIMMWGPSAGEGGNTNNGNSYFLEEGDWSGTGQTAANTDAKIPLLGFAVDVIPRTATVEQAKMRIYHFQSRQPCQAAQTLYASRLLKSWGEGTGGDMDGRIAVTGEVNWWWARRNEQRWQMGGARGPTDIAPPESSAQVSQSTLNTWIEWDVTQMARLWVGNPTANCGVRLAQDPTVGTSATMWIRGLPGFYSSEYATNPDLRPTLFVKWNLGPPSLGATRWELYR